MNLTEFNIKIRGVMGLLMHNRQLADPLNTWARQLKKVSSKRTKTDEDHAEMMRLEFMGGLYHSEEWGPFIPGEWIESCIRDAAKKTRKGKHAVASVFATKVGYPLLYDGPRDPAALFASDIHRDTRSVRVKAARIMRTRPFFPEWNLECTIMLNTKILSLGDFQDILVTAGTEVGMGDYRPKYGRFLVKSVDEKKGKK